MKLYPLLSFYQRLPLILKNANIEGITIRCGSIPRMPHGLSLQKQHLGEQFVEDVASFALPYEVAGMASVFSCSLPSFAKEEHWAAQTTNSLPLLASCYFT